MTIEKCPFCHSVAEIISLFPTYPYGRSFVQCTECRASSGAGDRDTVVVLWNSRAARTIPIWAVFADTHSYDTGRQWLVGCFTSIAVAKEAGESEAHGRPDITITYHEGTISI